MVSAIGEGIKDRLATLWDTTPLGTLVGYLAVALALVVAAFLYLTRDPGSQGPDTAVLSSIETSTDEAISGPAAEVPDPAIEQPGSFFVVGADIIDPEGNVFVPVGTNAAIRVTEYPYVFDGGNGGVNGRVDSIKTWGWNTIRASLQCYNETGVPSQQEVIDGIDATVNELTEARIVVVLACHDGTGADVEVNDEIEVQVRAFWDQVVNRYRDNPYVWFNFFNEPFKTHEPEQWLELHRYYYDRYRNDGVDNVMILDLPIFGQGIDVLAEDPFADELGTSCNTVLGWHAWGAVSGAQATVDDYLEFSRAATGRGLAVVISEAGVPDPLDAGTAGNPEWNKSGYYAALEVALNSNIGLLWWHGTGDTDSDLYYPLKLDKSGFWSANNSGSLTAAGATFWEYSHRERRDIPFEGDVRDSGCRSAADLGPNATG